MKAVLEQLVLLISLCPELVDGAGVQVEKLLRKFVEPTVKWMRSLSFLTSGLGCGFFALFGAVFFFTGVRLIIKYYTTDREAATDGDDGSDSRPASSESTLPSTNGIAPNKVPENTNRKFKERMKGTYHKQKKPLSDPSGSSSNVQSSGSIRPFRTASCSQKGIARKPSFSWRRDKSLNDSSSAHGSSCMSNDIRSSLPSQQVQSNLGFDEFQNQQIPTNGGFESGRDVNISPFQGFVPYQWLPPPYSQFNVESPVFPNNSTFTATTPAASSVQSLGAPTNDNLEWS